MPYDRSNPMASSSSRSQPQAPTLAKRTPVAPKLAAKSTAPHAAQRQTVTVAAPVPRRAAVRSESALSGHGSSGSLNAAYASPVAKLVQSNATPRSGSRQSRLSSANTSPNLADSPADNWDNRSGLGISAGVPEPPRSVPNTGNRDSKFFYASDASKGTQSHPPARAPTSQPRGPTFFYANGNNLPPQTSSPNMVSSPLLSPTLAASPPDPVASKFMYANGTPDLKPSLMNSSTGSAVSSSSRAPLVRAGSGPQREPSPSKPMSQPHLPTPSAPGPSIAERRSVFASTPQLGQNSPNLRRISADAPPRKSSGHSRSGSLVAEPPSVTRILAASPPNVSPLPSPLAFTNPGLSMASVLEAAEAFDDHDDTSSLVSSVTSPKSATGSGSGSGTADPLTELVANARRERKVQDLQITNASLEAINRTLERQLRKQTNELRRFKRLSRAGRLAGSRVVSDATSASETAEGPLNQLNLSDLSEEDSELDPLDDDLESELSESDSTGSAEASPITMASRDVRHRRQDEKRLQVDLSKHRQLLVDSQRMNQSIKRCLGWTEELISEGRRALAYQVRVSEVDIGGRGTEEEKPYIYDGPALWEHQGSEVDEGDLTTSEDGDMNGDADDTMKLRIERLRPSDDVDGPKNAQDRDSGIVLAGDAA
ncbi:hypothetical protein N0V93_003104 [Gnomoniopsis smithogilvyi]|uniref:Uncharacterized protein n=1 Tax=Gnomoniopsis smithogilvyi TaxID=1191159 RepID=A0A9W8YYQ3_9PEZI|nr:hypothetical protein N0V93_003104 [Gnomoniopsis smithogilvyi]